MSFPFVRLHVAWLAFLLIAARCSSSVAGQMFVDPIFGVSVTTGVQYGTNVDGDNNPVALELDVYQPTGAGLPSELPAVVLMHGGFFREGDKSSHIMVGLANEFSSRGYVSVAINYRKLRLLPPPPGAPPTLVPSRYPAWLPGQLSRWGVTVEQYAATIAAAVGDQAMAANWLAANAATYNVNPDWIAAGGYSAGAVGSLLLGAGAVDGAQANLAAVFSLAGGMFGQEPAVDSSDPPVFIVHGTYDDLVPFTEVGFLQEALMANDVPFESLIYKGGHNSALVALRATPDPFFKFMALHTVPEPSTLALVSLGAVALLAAAGRRRR